MVDFVGFFGDHKKKLREDLQKKLESVGDIDLELEDLDVGLEDIFNSLGDTFDSLGETFDSISDSEYGSSNGYTGASRQAEEHDQRYRMRVALAEDRAKLRADMKKMKKNLKKSMPRGKVNIQSGGKNSNNISVSGSDSVSISGTNGNLTMKIGNMRENSFKHKLTIREPNTDTITIVRYYDENNFSVFNDEQSGSFNINDVSIRNIKRYIRDDIEQHKTPDRTDDVIERLRKIRHDAGMDESSADEEFFREVESTDTTESFHDPIFLKRTWGGESGLPMEFDESAKITVSGYNAFGRKYEVKINGTAIYVPTIESLMDYCYIGDHLDAFIQMRSPAEKVILLKIIDGLIALKIAEPHHIGIKELL